MKSALFLAHSYHAKTRSSAFMEDLLSSRFRLTTRYVQDDLANLDAVLADLPTRQFDYLILWQVMPKPALLRKSVAYDHGVLFPMLDGCPKVSKIELWIPFRHFLIISFCRQLYEDLSRAGLSARYYRYFPAIPELSKADFRNNHRKGFYWYRGEDIPIDLILKICKDLKIESLHIHNAKDPGSCDVPRISCEQTKITISNWFDNRDELNEVIGTCSFYFAPRIREGIGMSFLEAMSLGRCVIAFNEPTMNEYIEHGVNGLLFNFRGLLPIDTELLEITHIRNSARNSAIDFRRRWELDCESLLDSVADFPCRYKKSAVILSLAIRFIKSPLRVMRRLS